jgi:hypothetical protein
MGGLRLDWHGELLELRIGRAGVRTVATLLRDGRPAGHVAGFGVLRLPLAGPAPVPTVLVLAPLPGVVARAALLVPTGDGEPRRAHVPDGARAALDVATAERHPFTPAPGTLAARLRDLEQRHPRLWASRHVVLAVGRVLGALLGLAALLQVLVRPLLEWLAGLLPRIDLPDVPWPDLPSIPWPDVDLPDLSMPGWLAAVLATAKFWVPLLVAVVLAVREVRRKRHGARAGTEQRASAGDDGADAHR